MLLAKTANNLNRRIFMKTSEHFRFFRSALLGLPLLFLGQNSTAAEVVAPAANSETTEEAVEEARPEANVEEEAAEVPPATPADADSPETDAAIPPATEETLQQPPPAPQETEPIPAPVAAPAPPEEPARQAEAEVQEVTREVERELNQRKTKIRGREEAQAVIDQILGAESQISQAEIARERRSDPPVREGDRQRRADRAPDLSPEQRSEAANYFRQRLRGENVDAEPPELLRLSETRADLADDRGRVRPAPRDGQPDIRRRGFEQPRYMNEGRRYIHFDSRAAIPAILMAAEALNRVKLQPVREVAPIFYEGSAPEALPPANYRDEDSWVVSYPVDEKSMITSDNILFQQGSTQFSDPYSFEIVSALADAMNQLPAAERFVVEGHASAEGGYDANMLLSQQRAERIVREMVRRGVPPNRLLPVGYGESEARHPADARERLRLQDRRVMVFRLKDEPLASR